MRFFRNRRRRRLKISPLPEGWLPILLRLPLYDALPQEDRTELHGHLQVFLAEKSFEGGGGFLITDEVRVVIAAQACLLLLHRETDYYPGLSSVVVYPGEYVAPLVEVDEAGIVTEGEDLRSGEFVREGALVLSWEDVVAEEIDVHRCYNVVLHEFAHQLDDEEGLTGGRSSYQWSSELRTVLSSALRQLRRDFRRGYSTVLDPYGTENEAELFAVATEAFFECPVELKRGHPELYRELARYYVQDPAYWSRTED